MVRDLVAGFGDFHIEGPRKRVYVTLVRGAQKAVRSEPSSDREGKSRFCSLVSGQDTPASLTPSLTGSAAGRI